MTTAVRNFALPPTGVSASRDTSAQEAAQMELQAVQAERRGEDSECIQLMEQALQIRSKSATQMEEQLRHQTSDVEYARLSEDYTNASHELYDAAERLVVKCNTCGVHLFKKGDFDSAKPLLDYCLQLTSEDAFPLREVDDRRRHLRGVTQNNLGCMERRRGHFKDALAHMQDSMETAGTESPVAYMNMSAILIQLRLSDEAAKMAERAVDLLANTPEDPSLLAVAHHNLAMALEPLDVDRCIEEYALSYQLACSTIGRDSETTKSIERSWLRYWHIHRPGQVAPFMASPRNKTPRAVAAPNNNNNKEGGAAATTKPGEEEGPVDDVVEIFPHPFLRLHDAKGGPRGSPTDGGGSGPSFGGPGMDTIKRITGRAASNANNGAGGAGSGAGPRASAASSKWGPSVSRTGSKFGSGGVEAGGAGSRSASGVNNNNGARGGSLAASAAGGPRRPLGKGPTSTTSAGGAGGFRNGRPSYESGEAGGAHGRTSLQAGEAGADSKRRNRSPTSNNRAGGAEAGSPTKAGKDGRQGSAQRQLSQSSKAVQDGASGAQRSSLFARNNNNTANGAGHKSEGGAHGHNDATASSTRRRLSPLDAKASAKDKSTTDGTSTQAADHHGGGKSGSAGGLTKGAGGKRLPPLADGAAAGASSATNGRVDSAGAAASDSSAAQQRLSAGGRRTKSGRNSDASPPLGTVKELTLFERNGGDLVAYLTDRLEMLLHDEEELERMYAKAVVIQRHYRGHLARRRVKDARANLARDRDLLRIRRNIAARKIQRFVRLHMRGSRFGGRRRQGGGIDRFFHGAENLAAVKLQRMARGWLARRIFRRKHRYHRECQRAATRIQNWYRGCLARRSCAAMLAAQAAAEAEAKEAERRDYAATLIQSSWRAHAQEKRTRDELRRRVQQKQEEEARRQFVAARRIQCAWRCAMARDLVSDLRFVTEQREAERKAAEKKRNATIKLQSFGRMIIVRRESMPQLTQARLRAAQIISKGKDTYKAAAMIQRAYRAHFAREELRRLKKLHHHELEAARHAVLATLMQRVGRGFEERRALQQEACELSQEAAQYQRQLAELHRLDVEKAETEKMMLAPETIKAVRMLSIEEDDARAELELEEMRKRRDCANVESRAAVSMEAQQEEATPEEEEDEEEAAFPADASTTAGSEDDDDNDDDDDEGAAPAPRHGTPPPPPTASALPSIPEAVMGLGRIIHAKKELRGRQARRDEYLRTLEAQEPHIHEQPAFTSATVDPFAHSDDDEDDENEAVPAVAQTAAPQAPATSSSPQQHQPDVAARDDADDADDVEAALASEACKGRPSRAQLKAEEQRRNDLLEARHQYRLKQIESASTAEQLKPFARTRLPLYPGATRPKRQPEVVEDLGAAVVGGAQAARAKREEELGHMVLRLYRGYQARCYTRALKELLQTYLDLLGDHGRFDGPQLDFTKLRYYSSIYRPITSWSPAKTPPEYKRFEAPSPASSISDTPEAIEEAEAEAEAEEVDEVVQPQQPQTAPAPSATAAPAVVAEEESEEARSERHASEVALEGFILVIKAKKERSARASLRDAYLDELHHQSSPLEGFAKIIKAKKELSVLKSQRDEYIRSIQQSSEAFAMEMGGTEEGSSRPDTAKQIAEEGQRLQKLEDDEVLFDEDERLSALKSQEAEFCSANKVGDVDEVVLADDGDHHDAPTRSPPQPPAMPSEAVEVPDVESTGTSRPNTGVVRGRPRPLSGADIEEDAAMEVEEQTPERGGSPEPPCRSESVATRAPEPSTDGSRPDTATQISRERTALLRLSGEVQLLNEMAELQNLQSQEVLINSFSPERVEERGDDAVCQELSALRHGDAESTDGSRPDTAAQIAQEHRRLVRLSGTEEILGEKQRLSCLASREEVANNSMPNSPNAEADEVVGSPGSARGSSTSASDLLTGFAKIIKAKKSVAARRSRCQQDVEKRVASESVERQEEEEAVEGHVVVVTPQRAAELLCGFAKVIQAKKCVAERKARRDAYLEHHERPDTTSSADAETADGDGAARMLQSFFRCVLARRDLMQLREAKYQRLATDLAREKMHDVSASCIQRAYRQHAARRGPESRREAAEQLVDDILSQNMGLPGAEEGAEPINAGASTAPPEPKEDRGLGTSYTDLDSARSASSNAIVREVDE